MVKIYTNKRLIPKEYELLQYNDIIFDGTVGAKDMDECCKKFMWTIDKAKIVDVNSGKVETPFGITSFMNLSTGLKTLLNMYIWKTQRKIDKLCVDITECGGDELFTLIFELAETEQISLLLTHPDIPRTLSVDVKLNDEVVIIADSTRIRGKLAKFIAETGGAF